MLVVRNTCFWAPLVLDPPKHGNFSLWSKLGFYALLLMDNFAVGAIKHVCSLLGWFIRLFVGLHPTLRYVASFEACSSLGYRLSLLKGQLPTI
jgi:hypothetical protein